MAIDPAAISDEDLASMAGCGSFDGRQETAGALLLARLTARRAAELYPAGSYPDDGAPQGAYRAATEAYVRIVSAALTAPETA